MYNTSKFMRGRETAIADIISSQRLRQTVRLQWGKHRPISELPQILEPPLLSPGQIIRQRREAIPYTIRELCEESGLAPSTIFLIENDRVAHPHPQTVRKLAKGLRLDEGKLTELIKNGNRLSA
jgi:hypothetical protein